MLGLLPRVLALLEASTSGRRGICACVKWDFELRMGTP